MKRSLLLTIAALVVSCTNLLEQQVQLSTGVIGARATSVETKTYYSDKLRFSDTEEMLLICEGMNRMVISNAENVDKSWFSGQYAVNGKKGIGCSWYSVYPASLSVNKNGVVSGRLPYIQKAPFDPSTNLMYSVVIPADYNEESQPSLELDMRQMAGLICITITNSEAAYKDEILESIKLKNNADIVGDFIFDIHSPGLELTGNRSHSVVSEFQSEEVLGLNEDHVIYLFVNPVTISDASLIVRTNKHTFKYESSATFTPAAGSITHFQKLNVADFPDIVAPTPLQRRLVCWGDSFTHGASAADAYPTILQELLGEDWIVYDGGQSGDRTYEIAVRQGGLPMVTGETPISIPAGTSKISIERLLRAQDVFGNPGYFSLRALSSPLTNPCELEATDGTRVLCTITSNSTSATLQRLEAGDPLTIAAHTQVRTWGARELKDADMTIIYMGANGMYTDEENKLPKTTADIDNLVRQHRQMVDYLDNPNAFIILGFHYKNYENYAYTSKFQAEFNKPIIEGGDGNDHFINLRTEVVKDEESCKKWLVQSGLYANQSLVPQVLVDQTVSSGDWPEGLYLNDKVHPNRYGSVVFAKLIYDRMNDMGYLDY